MAPYDEIPERTVEGFCNRVAENFLMPLSLFEEVAGESEGLSAEDRVARIVDLTKFDRLPSVARGP